MRRYAPLAIRMCWTEEELLNCSILYLSVIEEELIKQQHQYDKK